MPALLEILILLGGALCAGLVVVALAFWVVSWRLKRKLQRLDQPPTRA